MNPREGKTTKIKGIFLAGNGHLRPVWALLLTTMLAMLALWGLPLALGYGIGALFSAWNLNAATVERAPSWAQALYAASGWLLTMAGYAALITAGGVGCRLCHVGSAKREVRCWRGLLWAPPPLGITALLLAVDSLRLQNGLSTPQFGGTWLAMLCACLLSAIAEGVWFRRLFYGFAERTAACRWARLIAAALFAAHAAWRPDVTPLLALNMLLLGFLLLKPDGSVTSFVVSRFSFLLATTLLFAPAGGGALYALLDVSEDGLTGGALGVAAGGAMTAAMLVILLVEKRGQLRQWHARLTAREPKPAYVSGKRNKRPHTLERT